MRALGCLLLAAWPLAGQFTHLATDDAGDRVWFSSALRLSGAQQNQLPKIFTADASGNLKLVAQASDSDSYSVLDFPEVSGDGKTLAYLAAHYCPPQIACRVAGDFTMATVNGYTQPGLFHLSRNGRFAAREEYSYTGPTGQFQIIDLTTRKAASIPVQYSLSLTNAGRQVTSAGSVLAYSNTLWLFSPDGSAQFVPTANFDLQSTPDLRAAIDDAGDRIVYQAAGPGCALVSTAPSDSANLTTLVSSNRPCTMETLSADGASVLFLSAADFDGTNRDALPEPWIVDTNSKVVKSAGHDPAGIAEAVLSGDGSVVWAVTFAGRLIRTGRSSAATQEIVPRTTVLDQPLALPTAAPGALVHLTGRGLATGYGASAALQVSADGQALPLISVSPADVVFQVPWELQGFHTLTISGTQSPFEEILTIGLNLYSSVPRFWTAADGNPAIAHADFHGLVTQDDPAHPDEVLHLFLTGLGPATPPVATATASPSSPLCTMAIPIHVFWGGELPLNFPATATVLFAGMAPGSIGLEQVDVQLPHETPTQLGISVQGNGIGAYATIPVR